MQINEYGTPDSPIVLIQPVDHHDLSWMEIEAGWIKEYAGMEFRLITVRTDDWFADLTPWSAPAAYGDMEFGDSAKKTLEEILKLTGDAGKQYIIGGYSLAGLFALWAGCQTDVFAGVAAASPSVWYPEFAEYMGSHGMLARRVYLSLGDREEKTRNPIMATVGDRIREIYASLEAQGIHCCLEWNEGNHFRDPDLRIARAFAWGMK
jgi:hypothetical protein